VRCGEAVLEAGQNCGGDHRHLRGVARLVAPFRYAGTAGALVRRFKLDAHAGAGALLAREMGRQWRLVGPGIGRRTVFVPVPLHRVRQRERGFDQSFWLAQRIARVLGARVETVLVRMRATAPQGDPLVTSRGANVEGAFATARPGAVLDRCVVLVDDVFTSGATARECAGVLRTAGARDIAMLTACRS
jgi:ComF family protein